MTNNPRHNRLLSDYRKLRELEARSPFVQITRATGDPPTQYELLLTCKGITRLDGDRPVYSNAHRLTINLPGDYPRSKPDFKLLTPVFHPNISASSGTVCIGNEGDHGYAPSMGLDDLVLRIIQIIRYENWNKYSAYNGTAGSWADQHRHLLPLDTRQIVQEEVRINLLDDIRILDNSDDLDNLIRIL